MGQSETNYVIPTKNNTLNRKTNNIHQTNTLQYQGLLKFSKIPFSDCQQITVTNGNTTELLYVQKTRMSLRQLINSKARLGKKFKDQQILNIIKDCTYTLAYLQDQNVPYPLLTLNNIYFCQGKFKLLSPQMISADIFEKAKQNLKKQDKEILPMSPQMIIALRCHQCKIQQSQIMFKSNVFALGMLMLEVCTLKQMKDCYDNQNFDILDEAINQRICEIQDTYSQKIACIIANMLDYDFQERFSPKQLSFWVSRELEQTETENQHEKFIKSNKNSQIQSRIIQQQSLKQKNSYDRNEQKVTQKPTWNKQKHLKIINQKAQSLGPKQSIVQKPHRFMFEKQKQRQCLPNPYLDNKKHQKQNNKQNNKRSRSQLNIQPNLHKYQYLQKNTIINRNQTPTEIDKKLDMKYKYNLGYQKITTGTSERRRSPLGNMHMYDGRQNVGMYDGREVAQIRDNGDSVRLCRQIPQFSLGLRSSQNAGSTVKQYKNIGHCKSPHDSYSDKYGDTHRQSRQMKSDSSASLNKLSNRQSDAGCFRDLQREVEKSKRILQQVRQTEKFQYLEATNNI